MLKLRSPFQAWTRQRWGSKLQGGVGPFGLLTLATQNLEEFTPVFFRVFKVMCLVGQLA